MIFHDRYELLALRGGDEGEITLPGREISSGRDVFVHLLATGYTQENRELLATLDKLPAEPRRRVLDQGDHEGIPYVVTEVLTPKLKLREWVAAVMSAAPPPAPAAGPARSGVWKIPHLSEAPRASAPAPGASAAEPGEFTRLFQSVKEPERVPRPPTPDELPTAALAIPKQDQKAPAVPGEPDPGEFTRLLRSATPAPAAAVPSPAPAEPGAGEFTRMLQSAAQPGSGTSSAAAAPQPASVPTAVTPPAEIETAAPAQPELGEATRVFAQTPAAPVPPRTSSAPQPSGPVAPPSPPHTPPPSLQASAPGEFTRMMQSPLAAEPLRSSPAAPPAPSAGGFTRMMQAGQLPDAPPRPVPPPGAAAAPPPSRSFQPAFQPPGEFTRMFAAEPMPSENLAGAAAPQAPMLQGGAATGAFSRRATPPPQAVSGPSEFTQMIASSSPASAAKAPTPKPAPPAAQEHKSYLPLVLILAGLFLLVVIVIVVFGLTR